MAQPDYKNSNVKVAFPAPGTAQVGVALYLNVDDELASLLTTYWDKTGQSPSIAFSQRKKNEDWEKMGNAKLFPPDEKNEADTGSYSGSNEHSQVERPDSYETQPASAETTATPRRSFR
jgi:hypothetical protein|tara:strand:- start:341 stop:697 length:357 start_codon:yes stop_codon:yes gene_type:complete